ncbi:hypothetical protein PAMP_001539 [Pampus punctatissimus]
MSHAGSLVGRQCPPVNTQTIGLSDLKSRRVMRRHWDTLGGNEGQWDRAESVYEQQARVAGRRNSLSYGEGGGWFEPPPGVRPPDLDLKRDPYSYQDSLYGQVYAERDPRGLRKGSVPDLNHYERAPMAHRGSIPHQDYYSHDPAMTPRPPEGFYRPEHQPVPPHPHPLSRSGSHFGMTPGARAAWDQGQGGRAGPQGPSSPLPPPPPPPTAHELNRVYREPGAVNAAKMMPDGQQRIPSRDPSPAHYGIEHASPRYAIQTSAVAPAAPAPVQAAPSPVPPPPVTSLPAPLPAPPLTAPQTPLPVDPKKTVDPEFLALLRNEGLSESTISSLIQQGFDSTSMLAVMEENDVRTVAPNLGQARVLSRLVHNYKRPVEAVPPHSQPQTPMRARSNSFSHRSDIYHHQQHHHQPHPPHALTVDPQLMPPQTPGAMQTISPRMGDVMGRRPSSAPSQHLLEASGGYPGQPPRSPGPYAGAIMPVQSRPMSAYSSGMTMPGMPMQGMHMMPHQMTGSMPAIPGPIQSMPGMPQQMPVSMPALPQPPQQVPKAYSTNYTVPMELMKRDRNILPLSPMHSPHPSPQLMRKGGGPASDNSLIPVGPPAQGQGALVANQKLSRRTGPPVIVSTMASPDTSCNEKREGRFNPSDPHFHCCTNPQILSFCTVQPPGFLLSLIGPVGSSHRERRKVEEESNVIGEGKGCTGGSTSRLRKRNGASGSEVTKEDKFGNKLWESEKRQQRKAEGGREGGWKRRGEERITQGILLEQETGRGGGGVAGR